MSDPTHASVALNAQARIESATARQGQALDTRGAQGRCMGRWFPRRGVGRL